MKLGHRLLMGVLITVTLAATLTLIAAAEQNSLADGFIYVDSDATGANNGTTWDDAYTSLQAALEATIAGDQIWVAEGVYTPTVEYGGTSDRFKSFQLKNGVAIYGGFDPSEGDVTWEDRDWASNLTILSGDLNGDDGPVFANNAENSYHVLYHPEGTDLDNSAILDGFNIRGGNANGDFYPYDHTQGGGMYNYSSSPTLVNCIFSDNFAAYGGGMYNAFSSLPTLINCTFTGNSASGGGMYNVSSSPMLIHCTFTDNSASGSGGGGMYNDNFSSPTLTDCTFTGNSASSGGGMFNMSSSSPMLTNCSISDNTAVSGGGMYNISSSPTLTNSTFMNNSASSNDGGGMFNDYDSSPTLTNATFLGNSAANRGGGMYNMSYSSPTLTNCTFIGNSATYGSGGGMQNDSFTSPVLANCTFTGNSAYFFGGMGNYKASPTLTNVILWGNTPALVENYESTTIITYSDIQGGCPTGANCTQVIDADPRFVRSPSPGADGQWGTADDDYGDLHMKLFSPAIDSGNNSALPAGITTDLLGDSRFVDILYALDTGLGTPPIVDMGAYETQFVGPPEYIYLPMLVK